MANIFRNFPQSNVSANQVIYTVAEGTTSTLIGMTIANVTETAQTANVVIVSVGAAARLARPSGDSNTFSIVKNASVPVGGALVPVGGTQKLVLETGDSLTTSTSGNCDVILSVLEIT